MSQGRGRSGVVGLKKGALGAGTARACGTLDPEGYFLGTGQAHKASLPTDINGLELYLLLPWLEESPVTECLFSSPFHFSLHSHRHGRPASREAQSCRHSALRPSCKPARQIQTCNRVLVWVHKPILSRTYSKTTLGRYQALNQILAKSLQNEDRDCMEFATKLMDTVEAVCAKRT